MTGRHLGDEDLTLFHYGESEERGAVARHLLACGECRRAYDELLRLLETVDTLPVPARSPDYGSEVWRRLEGRLRPRSAPRRGLARPQRWAVAASLVLMLLAGFLVGRLLEAPAPAGPAAGPISEQGRERILLVALGQHLERSQRMLVEFVNAGGGLDLAAAQRRAESLLASNRLYRQSLSTTDEPLLGAVLEELERVLQDIAHTSPDGVDGVLEAVRGRIESRGLLFKVRVLGSQLERQSPRSEDQPSGTQT